MIPQRPNALCYAILIGIASAHQLDAQDSRLLPTSAPIQIYLTATGKDAATLISDRSHLIVSIDQNPTSVVSLRSAKEDKLLFAIVIDTSTSNAPNAAAIKAAATKIFQGFSNSRNQGYLVFFDARVRSTRRPLQPSEAKEILDKVEFRGSTALYDAVAETCIHILGREKNPDNPRRLIVLISDGDDNQSKISGSKAIEFANGEGVAIFSFASAPSRDRDQFLKNISSKTGGLGITSGTIGNDVDSLSSAINSQLVLSIDPHMVPDQNLHAISIRTAQKNISISAPAQISTR